MPQVPRVLVVTAVAPEADAVTRARCGFDVLAGGVGPAAAAAATAAALASRPPYDLVVSAGIGGGFAGVAPVGSVVVADEIVAADLGAETPATPEGFTPVTELGFGTVAHRPPAALAGAAAEATGAVLGTILTVSTVTGTAARAAALSARHPRAAAEAMEGFGAAEAAARQGVPVLEVRAVANPVGPRDRAAWRIPDALAALTAAFRALPPAIAAHSEAASAPEARGGQVRSAEAEAAGRFPAEPPRDAAPPSPEAHSTSPAGRPQRARGREEEDA